LNRPVPNGMPGGVRGGINFPLLDFLITVNRRQKGFGEENRPIAISCEIQQLPAPKIDLYEESTKVTLFSEVSFSAIPYEDRLWACYLHACIKQVQGEQLTNSSLRERFGLKESSSGSVSRLIKDAVEAKMIKPLDPNTAPRYMKYIPIWA